MTGFVQIGIAAIAAFTFLVATTIVMQAKERISAKRQEAWLTAQREGIASSTRVGRDMARATSSHTNPDDEDAE
jgi:hypothetical protein